MSDGDRSSDGYKWRRIEFRLFEVSQWDQLRADLLGLSGLTASDIGRLTDRPYSQPIGPASGFSPRKCCYCSADDSSYLCIAQRLCGTIKVDICRRTAADVG